MFKLHGIFKANNKTKQGEAFTNVIAAIQRVVIFVVVAAMVAYVLTHGGF